LYHEINRGKDAALRSGLAAATKPYIFVQNAVSRVRSSRFRGDAAALLDGLADMVYGSRFLGGPHRVLFFWHYIGNRLLTLLCDIITNIN
jgi:hypothetical protein